MVEHDENGTAFRSNHVDLTKFLSERQRRTLGHWPFLIPDFARFMKKESELAGMQNVKVYADILVSRNRKEARHIVPHNIDLASIESNLLGHDPWILLYAREGY